MTRRKTVRSTTPLPKLSRSVPCLRYAGLLGHRYVVTRVRDGEEQVAAETDDEETARTYLAEYPAGRLYARRKRGWEQIG